jgi:hypothetical protein
MKENLPSNTPFNKTLNQDPCLPSDLIPGSNTEKNSSSATSSGSAARVTEQPVDVVSFMGFKL